MNLFLSPHNDDEALFGSYILQTYRPRVIIITDSYIQFERGERGASWSARRQESIEACKILGVDVGFLGVPDKEDDAVVELAIRQIPTDVDVVFAPAVEDGGNWQHNLVGRVADEMFPRVRHYYTYTRTRDYPLGPVKVDATSTMVAMKFAALQCYKSQWVNCCRMYLEHPNKDEYINEPLGV